MPDRTLNVYRSWRLGLSHAQVPFKEENPQIWYPDDI